MIKIFHSNCDFLTTFATYRTIAIQEAVNGDGECRARVSIRDTGV